MINAKLQNIIDTKSAIGNAIVNKGGTITSETPFFNYAAQIDGISTGTPQTIFAASDGSKWALTNAVNLVNDAGNVTSDFNYWQPANNSTSDPILNVGTVGANISGNIRLVPVNQVNIAQYENIVINDTTGAKYVGYNGYDSQTNPTPSGNTTFNRWLLNNSASGTVLFANTTVASGGTYNGPNVTFNEANISFLAEGPGYASNITSLAVNNGFIFGTMPSDGRIRKFNISNLSLVDSSSAIEDFFAMTINDGFVFVGGGGLSNIRKFHESNLVQNIIGPSYDVRILSVKTNNSFVYVGGRVLSGTNRGVSKYHESNLVLVGNTVNYGGAIEAIAINNGFIYAGGVGNQRVQKFNESTLAFVDSTNVYGGAIQSITINNGFIYAAGLVTNTVQKFHESNLVFVGNTASYGNSIYSIVTSDGFIYAGGTGNLGNNRNVKKYYESNLAFVGSSNDYGGNINAVIVSGEHLYASGTQDSRRIKKWQKRGTTPETLTFYTATKIKE
jgi:hypothetical protein